MSSAIVSELCGRRMASTTTGAFVWLLAAEGAGKPLNAADRRKVVSASPSSTCNMKVRSKLSSVAKIERAVMQMTFAPVHRLLLPRPEGCAT
eukprot:1431-Rhodomonas_salina.2